MGGVRTRAHRAARRCAKPWRSPTRTASSIAISSRRT
jgi:hypothetical protein